MVILKTSSVVIMMLLKRDKRTHGKRRNRFKRALQCNNCTLHEHFKYIQKQNLLQNKGRHQLVGKLNVNTISKFNTCVGQLSDLPDMKLLHK